MPRGDKSAELRLRTFVAQLPLGTMVRLAASSDFTLHGMITRIHFGPCGEAYTVSWGDHTESDHYPMELRVIAPDDDDGIPGEPESD